MIRFTTRFIAILGASLMLLGVLAMPASAKPGGNAGASAACANGGYQNYTDANGNAFKNEGQCSKYAAQGNALVPVVTEDPAVTRCKQEAAAAGFDPNAFNIIAGTENNDAFTPTAGQDLFCGFGGADYVNTVSADDVFLGGADNDYAAAVVGTFNGGAGDDWVSYLYGTFNGGDGNDSATVLFEGSTFNGGAGDDRVWNMYGGTFNGGDGNDSVTGHQGGTFNQD